MQSRPIDPGALRRGTLAASVLHDIPLEPRDDGVLVGLRWDERDAWTVVTWAALEVAVDGLDPESTTGQIRLRDWLRGYLALVHLTALAVDGTPPRPRRAVALALPADHPLHPGEDWVVERVLGGVLDVGIGLRQAPDDIPLEPDRLAAPEHLAVPLPPSAARAAGVDTAGWWPALAEHRDRMAVLAADRLDRDAGQQRHAVLRPIGGCDVLTLLSGRWMRDQLAGADGTGMRAIAVPMRSRGWFDLARIDPAFVGAAAVATEAETRGVPRPLLVTRDEVGLAAGTLTVEQLARTALAEPVAPTRSLPGSTLYR